MLQLEYRVRFLGNELFQTAIESGAVDSLTITQLTFAFSEYESWIDLPIILAGKAGGRIRTGRHIRYENGTPLCNLYLWMMNQMGVRADSFGDSTGRLKNLG